MLAQKLLQMKMLTMCMDKLEACECQLTIMRRTVSAASISIIGVLDEAILCDKMRVDSSLVQLTHTASPTLTISGGTVKNPIPPVMALPIPIYRPFAINHAPLSTDIPLATRLETNSAYFDAIISLIHAKHYLAQPEGNDDP